jgi:S1-C subfamily serine protease
MLMYGGGVVGGEAIVSLDGNPIPDADVLTAEVSQHSPGDVVQVGVVHCSGSASTIPVTLGTL